jgi:hypothetical protein
VPRDIPAQGGTRETHDGDRPVARGNCQGIRTNTRDHAVRFPCRQQRVSERQQQIAASRAVVWVHQILHRQRALQLTCGFAVGEHFARTSGSYLCVANGLREIVGVRRECVVFGELSGVVIQSTRVDLFKHTSNLLMEPDPARHHDLVIQRLPKERVAEAHTSFLWAQLPARSGQLNSGCSEAASIAAWTAGINVQRSWFRVHGPRPATVTWPTAAR